MKTPITKTLMAIALTAMATFFAGCGPDEPDSPNNQTPPTPTTVAVTGVSLNKSSMTLTEGGSETLTASVAPSNATNTGVSWSSSNTGVATVNGGQVTAVKAGTATITVTTSDGGKTATCSVIVEAKKVAVTGVKLDSETLELIEGETGTIKVTVEPADATDQKVNWTSSNPEVVTVADGVVTAVAPGTATIIATTSDGGKTVTCNVTINPKPIPVEGVSVEVEAVEIAEGETTKIVVTITPDDATVKDVTFSSSDEAVATVDEEGNITAVGPGTATITITTADGGKTATCEVTVNPKVVPVEGIAFTKDQVSVIEGEKVLLYVSFTPKNASDKRVTWSSSDTGVATIDTKGNVTGVKPGTATITVKTTDGGKTATCEVTVTKKPTPVSGVKINRTALSLTVGGAADLVATVSPEDATNKKVIWSSSDESIVKVDQNGEVTAVKKGTAKVTATTEDGGKTATCDVTVTDQPVAATGVTLNKKTLTLKVGKTEQLSANVAPADATNHEVTWSSSNTAVATVDKAGKITAVKAGTATITVKTHNGKTATCAVTVSPNLVTKITLNKTSLTLFVGDPAVKLTATVTPSDASNTGVSWSSSSTTVATVDANGNVTPKGAGSATITCLAKDGSGVKATCSVTVSSKYTIYNMSAGVTVAENTTYKIIHRIENNNGALSFSPYDVGRNTIVNASSLSNGTSSNSSVATVSVETVSSRKIWKVTPVKAGSTVITLSYGDMTRKINITVTEASYSLKYCYNSTFTGTYYDDKDSHIIVPTKVRPYQSAYPDDVYFRFYNETDRSLVTGTGYSASYSNNSSAVQLTTSDGSLKCLGLKPGDVNVTVKYGNVSKIAYVHVKPILDLSTSVTSFTKPSDSYTISLSRRQKINLYWWYNSTGTTEITAPYTLNNSLVNTEVNSYNTGECYYSYVFNAYQSQSMIIIEPKKKGTVKVSFSVNSGHLKYYSKTFTITVTD